MLRRILKWLVSLAVIGTIGWSLACDGQKLKGILQKQTWVKGLLAEQKRVKQKAMMVTINHYRPDLLLWKDFVTQQTLPQPRFLKENVQYYEFISQYFPESAESYYMLAVSTALLGEPLRARELMQKSLELDPQFFYGWLNWAGMMAQEGRWTEAAQAYQRALACSPETTVKRLTTSRIYIELIKSMGLSTEEVVESVKLGYRQAYEQLTDLLKRLKDPSSAQEQTKITPRIF